MITLGVVRWLCLSKVCKLNFPFIATRDDYTVYLVL